MMAALSPKVFVSQRIGGRLAFIKRLVHFTKATQQWAGDTRNEEKEVQKDAEGFPVYKIEGLEFEGEKIRKQKSPGITPAPPRFRTMSPDQDWTDVWPTEATFKWSVVPFPVRQGFVKNSGDNEGVVPSSYANLELMKPPNFLHLTPGHIKKHCKALKAFCTEWPEALDEETCKEEFPITSITSDFVFSRPSVQDHRARVAAIKLKLSDLKLCHQAKVKFTKLVGDRYDKETDTLVLESDRCPLKTQNLEYVNFLLTAVYFESQKREPWEEEMELEDQDQYYWDINASRTSVLGVLNKIQEVDSLPYLPEKITDEAILCQVKEVTTYKNAVTNLHNEEEDEKRLSAYKKSVVKLLNLRSDFAV